MNGTVFYFAYGSNMEPERFRRRVGPWISSCRARLTDHRLRFASVVQSEGGGGAVVDVCPGGRVDGVLFEITAPQMEQMDAVELDPARDLAGRGRRLRHRVETEHGPMECEFYTVEDDGGFSPPSAAYLALIVRGLAAAGYGEDAVERVRRAAAEAAERQHRRQR